MRKLKRDGGIRPIAVGEVLRRLISKAVCTYGSPIGAKDFAPFQLGVGISEGMVAAVHALNHLVRLKGHDENTVLLKVDFANAFNLVDRSMMFEAVREQLPRIARWVEFCYKDKPYLFVQDHIVRSERGVQQGDPLGPILFAATIMPLLRKIEEECPGLLANIWYLDDGNIAGPIDQVAKAYEILEREGPRYGLQLNRAKCELWWPSLAPASVEDMRVLFPNEIPISLAEGTEVLGVPVGSSDYCKAVIRHRIDKIQDTLNAIKHVDHAQYELALIRKCAGFPRMVFSLRTVNPIAIEEMIEEFDKVIQASLSSFLSNYRFSENIRDLISLPVSMGGLAIPRGESVAPSAFVGSLLSSLSLQKQILTGLPATDLASIDEFADEWLQKWIDIHKMRQKYSLDNLRTEVGLQRHKQKFLTARVYEGILDHLKNQGDNDFQCLLQACLAEDSGLWTTVLPNRLYKTEMDSGAYSAALKMRYGIPILSAPSPCFACEQMVDLNCRHIVNCHRIHSTRHNFVRDALAAEARKANLPIIREPINLFYNEENTRERPADVWFSHLISQRPTCVDVSIVSPFQNMRQSSKTPGYNADRRASEKIAKYGSRCEEHGMDFLPFVMESLGGFHPDCNIVLRLIGRNQAEITRSPVRATTVRVKKFISLVWQMSLGRSLMDQVRDGNNRVSLAARLSPVRMF